MKLQIYLIATLSFLTLNAMRCDEDVLKSTSHLADIEVENLDLKDSELCITQSPVTKNTYTLGIKFIDKDLQEKDYLYYYQDSIVDQKIYCNTNFDTEHPKGSDITKYFLLYPHKNYNGAKLKLIKSPSSGVHSFKVCIYRKGGSYIEKDTKPIEFI